MARPLNVGDAAGLRVLDGTRVQVRVVGADLHAADLHEQPGPLELVETVARLTLRHVAPAGGEAARKRRRIRVGQRAQRAPAARSPRRDCEQPASARPTATPFELDRLVLEGYVAPGATPPKVNVSGTRRRMRRALPMIESVIDVR